MGKMVGSWTAVLCWAAVACGGTIKSTGDAFTDSGSDSVTDTWLADGPADTVPMDGDADTLDDEQPPYCGDEREPSSGGGLPIVNGQPTWDPTVVDLTSGQALAIGALMSYSGGDWDNICTATLIAPALVLTAAHCVRDWFGNDEPASSFRFAVGDDSAAPVHMFAPTEVDSNPGYSSWGGGADSDTAVLVFAEPLSGILPALTPIPYNCTPLTSAGFVGQSVQNVGYGITDIDWGAPPNTRKWWTVERVIALETYDFTVDGAGLSSVCNGDSGGPSLWTMPDGMIRVVGTVSWGDPSCVDEDHYARTDDNCTFVSGYLEGCGDVTEQGSCDGETATWCESGSLATMDCAASGMQCGDDGTGAMRCIDPGACGDLDWEGRCEGSDATWCDDGVVRRRACADCGQICAWADEIGAYYCIDPT